MSCTNTSPRHACIHCTTTPAALAARAQLGDTFTIFASAQKRPLLLDIGASTVKVKLMATRCQYGLQLHGTHFDETVDMLRGQSAEVVNQVLGNAMLNVETRTAIKHALGARR